MRFAVNYSTQGAMLWRDGTIEVDCFKCPAWPQLIDDIIDDYPLYIHYPLRVGSGIGDALNTETKQRPDWELFLQLGEKTHTPHFNVHLAPIAGDHADIPVNSLDYTYSQKLIQSMVADMQPLLNIARPENVVAENIYSACGQHPLSAIVPEVTREVIQETKCNLLLDISHARIAARELDMDVKDYINQLPVDRIKEIHVTGIQVLDDHWIHKLSQAGISLANLEKYFYHPIDHLPMVEQDWLFFQWALDQIWEGNWQEPEFITFEYSGIGEGFFQATTERSILAEQIPRFYKMVHPKI
jgi:uncharacterized protein (UPF0276 family)